MLSILVFFSYIFNSFTGTNSHSLNNRPIIGVLAQELTPAVTLKYPGKKCYIAASYVKYIEGSGGRVVPIFIGKDYKYYEDVIQKLNGVLLPGGSTYFTNIDGYADAGRMIFDIVVKMNDRGIYMPIWGTCLGFELLTYLSINSTEHRDSCNNQRISLPLYFTKDFRNSNLFKNIPRHILWTLKNKKSTSNFHMYCITQNKFKEFHLNELWKILSLNYDKDGLEFISTIEHRKYPFYGVQFHPEKPIYEFTKNRNINHDPDVVEVSQYFANFFVKECKKNFNSFPSDSEEMDYLIYNYIPTYTARNRSNFEQAYYFE